MKKEEWNKGLNHIDPELVEEFVKQKEKYANRKASKKIWLRFGAVAACLCIIIGIAIAVPNILKQTPTDPIPSVNNPNDSTDTHTPVIFDGTKSPESLTGSALEFVVGSAMSSGNESADSCPPAFEFKTSNIAVKARVVKSYPDTYYKLDASSVYKPLSYRLIKMEVQEVINGENVPTYFLYMIRSSLFVDMSVYDSLIISMEQIGTQEYIMRNETQSQMEALDLPVFADNQDHPELGNIIAFTDGIFDESLWQNESWLYGYQFGRFYLDNPQSYFDLVVTRGGSESDTIAKIKEQIRSQKDYYGENYMAPSVINLDLTSEAALSALKYVKPFENGVFSQSLYYPDKVIYRRYINGCQTEETVTIDLLTEEVTYSEVRYTKEDMAQLENIAVHISAKAEEYKAETPTPPHTDPEGKALHFLNLYGWYAKADGKVYGIVKTVWQYYSDDQRTLYYDDSYTLYDISTGTSRIVPRDALTALVGPRNIYQGEYGIGIEVPYE